ncbi:MAG: type II secretion system minor pseudopilin GspK [Candidatus Binataceae bacterium]
MPSTGPRGIALLVTMIAVALMSLLVVDFTTTAALNYRASANQANELRAACLARSGVAIGLALLAEGSLNQPHGRVPYDTLSAPWAQPFRPLKIAGGEITVTVVDEARKLYLHELIDFETGQVNPSFAAVLARLCGNIGVTPAIIPAIADWLDPDGITSPGGAEADYYLRLNPPYEPRNGPMPTIGDLRAVKGITDATFMRLARYLTVMPEPLVNANTAPPEVLSALSPVLENNPQLVEEIVDARAKHPFTTVTDIGNLPGLGTLGNQVTQMLTVRGHFFAINATGTFAGTRKRIVAIYRRIPNGRALLAAWYED